MTDATIVVIVAAIPPTLVALGGLIVSWRASSKVDEANAKVDHNTQVTTDAALTSVANGQKADTIIGKQNETVAKADTIIEKAAEIHTLTNSNLAEVKADLKALKAENEGLKQLLTEMVSSRKEAKELVDQAAAKVQSQPEADAQREKFKIG